jgi:hypothetical protein
MTDTESLEIAAFFASDVQGNIDCGADAKTARANALDNTLYTFRHFAFDDVAGCCACEEH